MAKVKPQRMTSINNTIDELKAEQDILLKNNTNIILVDIDSISELKLDNDILTRGLRQGDVLAINEDNVIAVNIPKDKALVVKVDDTHLVPKVCYEIGNRHATLFEGNSHNEFITIYSEPMKEMLEKIGANVTVEEIQFDFNKSISSSINAHHH